MKVFIKLLIGSILFGLVGANDLLSQSKAPVRVYLEHYRNSEKYELSTRVIAKMDKRYQAAVGVKVELYVSEIAPANLLEAITTNDKGTGIYTFSKEQIEFSKNKKVANYYAVVNENDSLKGKVAKITIKQVDLNVKLVVEDSIKQIHAHVSETDSIGDKIPQGKVKIAFYAERPLSPLPIGDDFIKTDKEGYASMAFPDDLPGNEKGSVKVLVRIVENKNYGTVEFSKDIDWGIPTIIADDTLRRSLWASGANAPISLLIFVISLIVLTWGWIFYIFYKVFEIWKLGKIE